MNTYRVEEVKRRINTPSSHHLTLTSIAFESGFNSKATFNRVFKQQTGLTPLQYVKKIRSQCAQ
jgi:AraC-like DNA-binding protein